MQSFERKINSDHNKTIIRLIRRKLYPLQFSKVIIYLNVERLLSTSQEIITIKGI